MREFLPKTVKIAPTLNTSSLQEETELAGVFRKSWAVRNCSISGLKYLFIFAYYILDNRVKPN